MKKSGTGIRCISHCKVLFHIMFECCYVYILPHMSKVVLLIRGSTSSIWSAPHQYQHSMLGLFICVNLTRSEMASRFGFNLHFHDSHWRLRYVDPVGFFFKRIICSPSCTNLTLEVTPTLELKKILI